MITSLARPNTMRPARRLLLSVFLVPFVLFIFYRSHWSTPKQLHSRHLRTYSVHINGRWQQIRRLYGLPLLPADIAFPLSRAPETFFTPKVSLSRAARFDLRRKRALEESRPPPLHISNANTYSSQSMKRTMEDIAADFRARALAEKDIAEQKFRTRAASLATTSSFDEYLDTRGIIIKRAEHGPTKRRPLSWGPRTPKISLQDTPKT